MSPARVEFPSHPERSEAVIDSGHIFTEITHDHIFVATGTDEGFFWFCTDRKNKRLDEGVVVAPDKKNSPDGAVVIATKS